MKHSFFRRLISLAAAALLMTALLFPAGAEGALRSFYEAGGNLLFNTANVTCEGRAVFRLDGVKFKTAEFRCVQVGNRSMQDLKLLTPRADGTERESGYIIFDEGGTVTVMERFFPGTYQRRRANPSTSIMNTSVYLDQLVTLGGNVVDEVEKALGNQLQVSSHEAEGTSVKLSVAREDIPALGQSALNFFWDYFMKRFYFIDYDTMPVSGDATFTDYGTLFDGIRFVTARVALEKADLELSLDASGRIKSAGGLLTLALTTHSGAVSILDIDFSFSASAYGSSTIKAFKPEDYNVVRINPYD